MWHARTAGQKYVSGKQGHMNVPTVTGVSQLKRNKHGKRIVKKFPLFHKRNEKKRRLSGDTIIFFLFHVNCLSL
jgi:hypothetical protein